MQEHFARMHSLAERLAGLLAVGVGLSPSVFDNCFTESLSALRLLHYSAEVRASSLRHRGVMGTGAHSDYGLITLL
ncbi:unnamed protein product, partial [Scytosiphon promiscuus]